MSAAFGVPLLIIAFLFLGMLGAPLAGIGGVAGGIWLLIQGQWRLIAIGLAWDFVGSYALLWALRAGGSRHLFYITSRPAKYFLSLLQLSLLTAATAAGFLLLAPKSKELPEFFPQLLWAYSSALTPLAVVLSRGEVHPLKTVPASAGIGAASIALIFWGFAGAWTALWWMLGLTIVASLAFGSLANRYDLFPASWQDG